jgi:multiple sugar transport system substrate-binding protein
MKAKIQMILLLGACFVLLTVFSCKKEDAGKTAGETVTVRFLTYADSVLAKPLNELAAHAESVNPGIKLELELISTSWWDMVSKYVAQIAAGDPADMICTPDTVFTNFVMNNYIMDIGPRIKTLDMTEYYEFAFRAYAGKQIMVPVGLYTQALYYNRDMFIKAGVPEPGDYHNPWTFQQFRDAAKKLTTGEGPDKVFGFSTPFDPAKWSGFLWGNGGDFFDKDGRPALNSPLFKETCQYLVDMVTKDGSMPNPTNTEAITPTDLFISGRCAMLITGQWDLVNLKKVTDFKIGVAAGPFNPAHEGAYSAQPIFLDGYAISTGTKHEEEAWKVIVSFVDETAADINARNGVKGWPLNKKYAESHTTTLFTPPIDPDQYESCLGIDWVRYWPATENWTEMEQSILRYFQLMTLGEMSVDEACETLQAENMKLFQ